MEWIGCKDKLPETSQCVIVCNAKHNIVFVGKRIAKQGEYNFEDATGNMQLLATHWMPIPQMPEEKLKSCPFCGFVGVYFGTLKDGHRVECSHCGCRTKGFNTKYEAGKQWNKRRDNG